MEDDDHDYLIQKKKPLSNHDRMSIHPHHASQYCLRELVLPDRLNLWNFHLKFKMGHNDFNEIWGELHSVKPITSHHL